MDLGIRDVAMVLHLPLVSTGLTIYDMFLLRCLFLVSLVY